MSLGRVMRTEFKYLLTREKYFELKDLFQFIFRADKFSRYGAYPVTTVYFDTPTLNFFYDKVNGEYTHKKARLRTYGESMFDGPTYFEYKIKNNENQFKKRFRIEERADYYSIIPMVKSKDDDFLINLPEDNLIPVSCVKYYRAAYYYGHGDEEVRLNFDLDISISEVGENPSFENLVFPEKAVILEVKSPKRFIDEKLKRLLAASQAHRTTFSKYATGINIISSTYRMETPNEF